MCAGNWDSIARHRGLLQADVQRCTRSGPAKPKREVTFHRILFWKAPPILVFLLLFEHSEFYSRDDAKFLGRARGSHALVREVTRSQPHQK
jgi:hypothetical protein